ncbi:MAG TPA: hypothetical protein VK892_03640 [Pyrinomonadaceae bacterium]|nr:hypothetical protein [Pyrinomonadaceae bacterium]
MLRALVLSLVLLIGLGAVVPLATDYAEAGTKKSRKNKKKRTKKVKKYSKQWWRMYRAKQKRKKALAARKRALRQRTAKKKWQKMGDGKWIVETAWNGKEWVSRDIWIAEGTSYLGRYAHQNDSQPVVAAVSKERRERQVSPKGELQFKVKNTNGTDLGSAAITVVGPAVGESRSVGANRTLGGVSTGSLRRTVIDQMIRENGWVVNDYQKQVGGQQVYVVVAQSPGAGGNIHSRLFYFTEVDGRIYSVATNSPRESSGQIADEAEKVVNVLRQNGRTVQAGIR